MTKKKNTTQNKDEKNVVNDMNSPSPTKSTTTQQLAYDICKRVYVVVIT